MANERQFRTRTRIVATRGVREYRASIPCLVRPDDVVLETGCEWGTTTAILAEHAAHVVGTDVSPACVERARKSRPELDFRVLDAYDIRTALDFGLSFTKVYIDLSGLSGYRGLLDVIALVNGYAATLGPDTVVVKSGGLKHFAERRTPWDSRSARGG